MGSRPSRPTEEQVNELESRLPELLARAGAAINHADVLLLATGAGWSADSGLAVYKDVADVQAYRDRGLTYRDICQPDYLVDDPELFYGFWGGCFNDYRETKEHEGYHIVRRWVDRRLRGSRASAELQDAQRRASSMPAPEPASIGGPQPAAPPSPAGGPQPVPPTAGEHVGLGERAGAFFAFTSNVDAHSHRVFEPHEIFECHGHSENWQCGSRECAAALAQEAALAQDDTCRNGRWRVPDGYRFAVDEQTRLARPDTPAAAAATQTVGSAQPHDATAFASNWPRCVRCGEAARPAILMFGDHSYANDDAQHEQWEEWRKAVLRLAPRHRYRVVVCEVGCGGNVTTVRRQAETLVEELSDAGVDATLIRINPELPLADTPTNAAHVLPILSTGLAAIRRIDRLTTHTPTADEPLAASTYADAPLRGFLPITPIEASRARPAEGSEGEGEDDGAQGDDDVPMADLGVGAGTGTGADGGEDEGGDDDEDARRPRKGARAEEPSWEERLKALSDVRSTLASTDCLLASIETRHEGAEGSCGSWERLVSKASVASAARRAEGIAASAGQAGFGADAAGGAPHA